jgi:superfamily II DNA or RNA helicase
VERRRFNSGERAALYLAADGRCSSCGIELADGWHADHVAPYARGGITDVINGQALCPRCNQQKGDRSVVGQAETGWSIPLREWQQEAHNVYVKSDGSDVLCVATPGAGKTIFGLYVAWSLYTSGVIERVVVVTPTDHLRTQWVQAAARIGIDLQGDFRKENGVESADYGGLATTYQAVAQAAEVYRAQCRRRTLVIFDEPHHMNGHRGWGAATKRAFEHALKRLSITGTPFRSDNAAIPFVNYDDGRCVPDYRYGYAQALRDGVCRQVYFPSYEGKAIWWTNTGGERTASLDDEIPSAEESYRLNTIIDASGEWLRDVIRDADARLMDIRSSIYADAAGLIITRDQIHARAVARLVRQITGEDPAIAVSDDPKASDVITQFSRGRGRWMVAVRMVSEGVDIPRLFVGVYATNIMTELYFRQAVGRFVRTLPGVEDQAGWLFIPAVDRLIEYVEAIKTERDHVLGIESEIEDDEDAPESACDAPRPGAVFTPLGSEASASDVWLDGMRFQQSELAEARVILQDLGVTQRNEVLTALIMRRIRERDAQRPEVVVNSTPLITAEPVDREPLDRQKERARSKIRTLVNRYVAVSNRQYSDVHGDLNFATGGKIGTATMAQLEERIRLLGQWLEDAGG